MIIKDSRQIRRSVQRKWLRGRIVSLLISGMLIVSALVYFSSDSTADWPVECNMEKVRLSQFQNRPWRFDGGKTQSSAFARSGTYASRLPKGKELQFGFSYILQETNPGDRFKATIWRFRPHKGNSALVVSMDPAPEYYRQTDIAVRKEPGGWELLELYFSIPYGVNIDQVKVYVYSDGLEEVYFDDFKLEKLTNTPQPDFQPALIDLVIKHDAFEKLDRQRRNALATGILTSGDKDFVNAQWLPGGEKESVPVSVRLKGDWLDHLQGRKWSFRINAKDPFTWQRMVSFSVHTPQARDFLKEWVFHQFLEKEDVLTTRYDFLELQVNGEPWGIYAWEEHFEKQLIEYKHRREGPILKFNEEGFWANIQRQFFYMDGLNPDVESYAGRMENSDIQAFNEDLIVNDTVLRRQYLMAIELMSQFRNRSQPPSRIFDLPLMAKYFAACDVFGAYHGIAWHNLRFYYNPITHLLEPIGFDGFSGEESFTPALLGQGAGNPQKIRTGELFNLLFADSDFLAQYMFFLQKYADREFLRQFYAGLIPGIRAREAFLRKEFPDYRFREDQMIERAQFVNAILFPHNDQSIKAGFADHPAKGKVLQVRNAHTLPLQIVGFGTKTDQLSVRLPRPVLLPAATPREVMLRQKMLGGLYEFSPASTNKMLYEEAVPQYLDLPAPSGVKYVFYSLPGLKDLYYSIIRALPIESGVLPEQLLMSGTLAPDHPAYMIRDTQVIFRKGAFSIDQPIVVPKGYSVRFEAGSRLDFVRGAYFLSYAPVDIFGRAGEPVEIVSSDHSARGFTLIKAGKALFQQVVFKGFNTLRLPRVVLTGAVNLYETDIEMRQVTITGNHCEDALNIIRSEFNIKGLTISDTYADGFDSDFCKGRLEDSRFMHTGNDCIDFSGSIVQINRCRFEDPGDKGVSIGEESQAVLTDLFISQANIGIASKDLSVVMADRIQLENCDQGFAGYQKKPEYGGSTTIVKSYTAHNVKKLFSIAKGSEIQIDGKILKF